jgi:predicted DNA-binding transcriptional regulator AlpA
VSNTIKPRQTRVVATITASAVRPAALVPSFDLLPDSAFIREAQLVQSHRRPNYPTLLPFSAATLWRKVKAGTFCKPYKLSDRVTAFKVGEVRAWITAQTLAMA